MKAFLGNTIIAESDSTVMIEGNHYFPPESVHMMYLRKNGHTYTCPWKGHADYYDVVVGDMIAVDSAWCYPNPTESASSIAGYFGFWHGVSVSS